MLGIIINENGIEHYFYRVKNNEPQIFTFETPENANKCIELFSKYAIQKLINESRDSFGVVKVMQFCANLTIKELPEMECKKISFEELMKEKGYEI